VSVFDRMERQGPALDAADTLAELDGFPLDRRDDPRHVGRFDGAHFVNVEERDGGWWVACTEPRCHAWTVEALDRGDAIRKAMEHHGGNVEVRTPEGEWL
jgi:hypothetical protein